MLPLKSRTVAADKVSSPPHCVDKTKNNFHAYDELTGITNQQAQMINSTYKSNDDVDSRADTLKSDSNLKTPFSKEIHRIMMT